MRPLNDRIAEAMRRERLGVARPLWVDCNEVTKADWLSRADSFLRLAKSLGVSVSIDEGKSHG